MPDVVFNAIGVLTSAAVLGAFFVILRRSARLLPQEAGRMPIYQERGGALFGFTNFSRPFVRVAVYGDLVVLSAYKAVLLAPRDIVSATVHDGLLSGGVRIVHCNPQLPDPLIVWSSEPSVLAAAINRVKGSEIRSAEVPPSRSVSPR